MHNDFLFILSVMLVVSIALYLYLKDVAHITVSQTSEELMDLASKMYRDLKGSSFVLSAGELNYKAYYHFAEKIETILKNNKKAKFTIYCGPAISISKEYRGLVKSNGKLKESVNNEKIRDIHPIINLLYKYPNQIILKIKNTTDEHFFYSEEDRVAWKERYHKPFEETVSYFKSQVDKKTLAYLKALQQEIDKSATTLTMENIKDSGTFYTRAMFQEEAVA
jgi:hypothetical protein